MGEILGWAGETIESERAIGLLPTGSSFALSPLQDPRDHLTIETEECWDCGP